VGKTVFVKMLLGFALVMSFVDGASAQSASYCRQQILHSHNQNLGAADLNVRKIEDIFFARVSISLCRQYAQNTKALLTASCQDAANRGLGIPANSQISFKFIDDTGNTSIKTYTAFCQDLNPQAYYCSYWDKVANVWVETHAPGCDDNGGGGDGGGDGGGTDGGGP
jgi:hypothetical protein